MKAWEKLAESEAPDGSLVELLRRGHEFLLRVGGYDLMSNEDQSSARALAELGCAHLPKAQPHRVLVGGLGMGFSLRAALDHTASDATVEVAELIPDVVLWNRTFLAELAERPLDDPRAVVLTTDVAELLAGATEGYDAILLDVDNGPDALQHPENDALYQAPGLQIARNALKPGGTLAVWSFSDDPRFTQRLKAAGFRVEVQVVLGSRKGRGRRHQIWLAYKGRGASRAAGGRSHTR